MANGIFITGTDTEVGKTWFTVALMTKLKEQGYRVAGMKPVSSGGFIKDSKQVNEDALHILENCSADYPYELINPFIFEPPIAPHIAAAKINQQIDLEKIAKIYFQLTEQNDFVIVEGVGGWRVPLSNNTSLRNIVDLLNIPVLLVVGLKLGCINHALLTTEIINADGHDLCAWASNKIDKEYLYTKETNKTLADKIQKPCIAEIPFLEKFSKKRFANNIDLSAIIDKHKA